MATQSCSQMHFCIENCKNSIIQSVFYIQFLLFSMKFLQFVSVRSASIKVVNTSNCSQSDSTIHSSPSNFTEYHITIVVKDEDLLSKALWYSVRICVPRLNYRSSLSLTCTWSRMILNLTES